jgi:glycyl-tRNA synthetase beta subunit
MVRSDYKKAVLEIGTEELPARYMSIWVSRQTYVCPAGYDL